MNKTDAGHSNHLPSPPPLKKKKKKSGGGGGGGGEEGGGKGKSRSKSCTDLEVLCGPMRVAAPIVIMDSPSRRVSFVNTRMMHRARWEASSAKDTIHSHLCRNH